MVMVGAVGLTFQGPWQGPDLERSPDGAAPVAARWTEGARVAPSQTFQGPWPAMTF